MKLSQHSVKLVLVRISLPNKATDAETEKYVTDAVTAWGGGMHPDEVFYNIEKVEVKVL